MLSKIATPLSSPFVKVIHGMKDISKDKKRGSTEDPVKSPKSEEERKRLEKLEKQEKKDAKEAAKEAAKEEGRARSASKVLPRSRSSPCPLPLPAFFPHPLSQGSTGSASPLSRVEALQSSGRVSRSSSVGAKAAGTPQGPPTPISHFKVMTQSTPTAPIRPEANKPSVRLLLPSSFSSHFPQPTTPSNLPKSDSKSTLTTSSSSSSPPSLPSLCSRHQTLPLLAPSSRPLRST